MTVLIEKGQTNIINGDEIMCAFVPDFIPIIIGPFLFMIFLTLEHILIHTLFSIISIIITIYLINYYLIKS